jgi:prefoldin subunit 5
MIATEGKCLSVYSKMPVKDIIQLPFVQVALPIIVMFVGMMFYKSKRFDDLRDSLNKRIDEINKRIDEVMKRLDRIEDRLVKIEDKLADHDGRIARTEERTALLRS